MTDYLNKKVNFLNSKISVKVNKQIYSNGVSKIFLCSDVNNPSLNFCVKIVTSRSDDKISCNSINTEMLILVNILILFSKVINERQAQHRTNN